MPFERERFLAVAASQTFTVSSRRSYRGHRRHDNPLAVRAEGHASHFTGCPLSVSVSWPVAASQTFTVLSQLPLTIRLPSGLKATL